MSMVVIVLVVAAAVAGGVAVVVAAAIVAIIITVVVEVEVRVIGIVWNSHGNSNISRNERHSASGGGCCRMKK